MTLKRKEIYLFLKERDGLICRICGGDLTEAWKSYEEWLVIRPVGVKKPLKRRAADITLDHKMPKSLMRKNGANQQEIWDISNLQLAHRDCNSRKGSSTLI